MWLSFFFSDRWAAKFSKVWGFACTPAARKSSAIICKKKCFFFKPLKLWAYLISAGRVTTAGITQKNNDKQQTWNKDFHFASRAVPCKSRFTCDRHWLDTPVIAHSTQLGTSCMKRRLVRLRCFILTIVSQESLASSLIWCTFFLSP